VRALRRERLTRLLSELEERLLLVVAPAGSGKTTLLVQFACDDGGPIAWYWPEGCPASSGAFLNGLEQSLAAALPGIPVGWESPDDVGIGLESWTGPSPLLVVDDFHLLQGSPAEGTLERVILRTPALRVAIASRAQPHFNLSRMRVSGSVVEIGPDELRFRSWEVERLFRDFFGEPLPPEDLALLTRRTEGWAAALQLFHLATRGRDAYQRRRTLSRLSSRSKLMREYLARNIIDELPPHLRDFMTATSVLGRLSARICDELLDTAGSDRTLEELKQRQLVASITGEEDDYCYHEVLRAHLEVMLVEELGEAPARERYRRAGAVLDRASALPEALHAFCRAEDWEAVQALLGRQGEQLSDGSPGWMDLLPPAVSRNDPWLLLAAARHCRAAGRFRDASRTYQEAERAFGTASPSEICRQERLSLTGWIDPASNPSSDWLGVVRMATAGRPLSARVNFAAEVSPPERALATALATLLAGHVGEAGDLLDRVADDPHASRALVAGAEVARAVARMMSGDASGPGEAERAADGAERLGLGWLARMGRASLVLTGGANDRSDCESARRAFESNHDPWGAAIAALMEGWGALAAGRNATGSLEVAMLEFHRLRAGVLETWARAALSLGLARTRQPGARRMALRAQVQARFLGIPGAQVLAYAALAETDRSSAAEYRALAAKLERDLALVVPGGATRGGEGAEAERAVSGPSLIVRCFGGFSLTVGGTPVDLAEAKPRARQMLRLLALHAGRPVHREVLTDALWPNADVDTAGRCVQVAVSSLRRVLEPNARRGDSSLIVRDGEAYRLALPEDASVDLIDFDRALAEGGAARARGDTRRSIAAYRAAVDIHCDELLPEDGPSEWVVRERERRAAEACGAAQAIAEILLEEDDPKGAATASLQGLRIDRYQDELWRLRIAACDRAGELGAALLARREYDHALAELGLPLQATMTAVAALSGRGWRTRG
jgi:DNA-binding SARP family transcriptional activator